MTIQRFLRELRQEEELEQPRQMVRPGECFVGETMLWGKGKTPLTDRVAQEYVE